MGRAFGMAVAAGRIAYLSGPGEVRLFAEASSPLTGFLRSDE
jgi:thiazole synthase